MLFLGVLFDDCWYKNVVHFSRLFLAISGRFGNNLKTPYHYHTFYHYHTLSLSHILIYNLTVLITTQCHCLHVPTALLPLFLPSRQRSCQFYRFTMKLRYFRDFFRYYGICRFFLRQCGIQQPLMISGDGTVVRVLASHPMWPRFDSRTRRHMWVDRDCCWFSSLSREFYSGFSGLPRSTIEKATLLNTNSIGNSRATGLPVACVADELNPG